MNIVNFRARRKSRAADAEEFADAGTRLDGPLAELEINGPGEEGNPAEQDDGNQDNQPPSQPPTPDSRARWTVDFVDFHGGIVVSGSCVLFGQHALYPLNSPASPV